MDYRIVFKRSETTGGGLTKALAGGFTVFVMELKNVTMKELYWFTVKWNFVS